MPPLKSNKKPGAMAGFSSKNKACDSYLADLKVIGRRAREVMPAAMRALVRMSTVARVLFMEG